VQDIGTKLQDIANILQDNDGFCRITET